MDLQLNDAMRNFLSHPDDPRAGVRVYHELQKLGLIESQEHYLEQQNKYYINWLIEQLNHMINRPTMYGNAENMEVLFRFSIEWLFILLNSPDPRAERDNLWDAWLETENDPPLDSAIPLSQQFTEYAPDQNTLSYIVANYLKAFWEYIKNNSGYNIADD